LIKPVSRVDKAGIAPVKIAEGPPQPVRIARHQDDVNMVGHQAIGPDLGLRAPRCIGQQIEIDRIIAVLEKGPLAPIAALGHMMRNAGHHEARKAGHVARLWRFGG
jgi:hypothetical protein